jgi:hypothetical protein
MLIESFEIGRLHFPNRDTFKSTHCFLPNVSAQAGRDEGSGQTARRNPALPAAEGSPSDDQIL